MRLGMQRGFTMRRIRLGNRRLVRGQGSRLPCRFVLPEILGMNSGQAMAAGRGRMGISEILQG